MVKYVLFAYFEPDECVEYMVSGDLKFLEEKFDDYKRTFEEYWQEPDSRWVETDKYEDYAMRVLEREGYKVLRTLKAIMDEKTGAHYLALMEVEE